MESTTKFAKHPDALNRYFTYFLALVMMVSTLSAISVFTDPTPAKAAVAPLSCAQGGECQVGDIGPGGGEIFYVAPGTFSCGQTLTSTCQYLEAAPITGDGAWTDATYAWSENIDTGTGATATSVGTGYSNTLKMVRQVGAGTTGAGSVSRNYRGGGKNDWYLPSKDELNQLCKFARGFSAIDLADLTISCAADQTLELLPGFASGYWSSSEYTVSGAWDQGFYSGYQGVADPGKQQTTPVRPIRAFGSTPSESAIVYVPAIAGVTAPVWGATPVTTVTAANGYTGTVSWSDSPTTFDVGTVYTATITLTALSGFTLTGVPANFFTVVGATSVTHAADSGVITAEFPETSSLTRQVTCGTGTYTVTNGVASAGGTCTGSLVIASDVTEIATEAFRGAAITSLTLPANLQIIRYAAFYETSQFPNLTIPDSVTLIEGQAFEQGQFTSLTLGNGLTSIGGQVFYRNYGVGINSITFGTGLNSIGFAAFQNFGVEKLILPEGLITLSSRAFDGASTTILSLPNSLTSIDVDAFISTSLRIVKYCGTSNSVINFNFGTPRSVCGAIVEFNPNLGSGSMDATISPTNTTLPTNTFTRSGYTFQGWNTQADGLGTPYAENAVFPISTPTDRTLYAVWLANLADPVIAGVTAPVSGATPVTTVTATDGYTGTVSWSGSPTTFALGTAYTATITLTASPGFTLTGVPADFFTVAGATSVTHAADSGVITAVFPVTEEGQATKVAITQASSGTERGVAFTTQPQITIQDASNNPVNSATSVVTATITSGAGGTLVGATTATASSGVATFTNLGIDGTVGTTYTITYSSPDLTSTTASITLTGTACDGATFDCQVGDIGPGGGKIFYVAPTLFTQLGATGIMCSTRCKYLEAAPTSGTGAWTDAFYRWSGNINTLIGTTGTAIGTGYKNTLAIIAQSNASSKAATVSQAYQGPNNLSDWFLPSKDELNKLFLQKATVGGFQENYYWSSSESDATNSFDQNFVGGFQGTTLKDGEDYVRPIRAFGPPASVISIPSISGVTAPVRGATPVTSVTAADGYTGTVSWSGSPTTFASSTMYTATITLTASSGFTLTGVTANFFTVVGATSVTHAANSGVITAVFPATAAPAAEPVPFLISLTAPKLRLSTGKLICTPGTYNAGYTLAGVVQGSSTTLFTPSSFTYNLLVNGVVQSSLAITTNNSSHSWNMPTATSGSVVTCSTTVSAIGVTNTNYSSDNTSGVSAALSTQTTAITNANKDYSVALNVNSKAYQKALVDNRATWRSDVEANRSAYLAELNRIGTLTASKTTRTLRSAALKKYMTSQKKISADYAASKPAALAARDAANKTALASRDAATAKANAAYGAFMESIGYGVLIP